MGYGTISPPNGGEIYCWGSGRLGKLFAQYAELAGYIDGDMAKQGTFVSGLKVCSLEQVERKQVDHPFFIIITTNQHSREIGNLLKQKGYIHHKDFCTYKEWFQKIFLKTGKVIQGYIEFYITDRCTLKCKACALLTPYAPERSDFVIDGITEDIDAYFSVVDHVIELRLLGGEPLLHRKLGELLLYLQHKYAERYDRIKIVSNGTVVPDNSLLETMHTCQAELDISDYSQAVPLAANRREHLLNELRRHDVEFQIMPMDRWIKMFPYPIQDLQMTAEAKRKLFTHCDFGCRTVWHKKLYFCSQDCAAKRIGAITNKQGDYLDLCNASKYGLKEFKERLLTFDMGNVDDGFVEFCGYCYGRTAENSHYIPVAEQL